MRFEAVNSFRHEQSPCPAKVQRESLNGFYVLPARPRVPPTPKHLHVALRWHLVKDYAQNDCRSTVKSRCSLSRCSVAGRREVMEMVGGQKGYSVLARSKDDVVFSR